MVHDPLTPIPIPEQAPATQGIAELPGTRLGYWDTGGNGTPVIFLHPASGSALIWLYQQPVFAQAGYRVIGYSRRNYYNSELAPADNPGIASADLHNLSEFLGVKKFHAVSSAAGGSVAADYAFSHPERLLSLTVSSNNLAARDGYIADAAARIKLQDWKRYRAGVGNSAHPTVRRIPRVRRSGGRSMNNPKPAKARANPSPTSSRRRSWKLCACRRCS